MLFNIGVCKSVYRCQSLFPPEFDRSRYENGSKEQGRAELLFRYCDQLLWNEGPDAQDQRQMTEMQISRLCPEDAEDLIPKARDWAEQANWKTDEGHPWEMIEFYRALLLSRGDVRLEHLKRAGKLVAGGDVTLQVIACVITGALVAEGAYAPQDYAALVEKLIQEVPYLGASRLAALRAQSKVPVSALDLAKKVLPFNFR